MAHEHLQVRELCFTYSGTQRPALDGIELSVPKGRSLSIMGRSGSGKSSLCFSLRGLIPESYPGDFAGDVLLDGYSISRKKVRELAGDIGIVFQDFESQLLCTTVELEVAFTPQHLGLPLGEIRKRVSRYLELVGLREFEKRDPATLSGGEKQRLALAAVLAAEPHLLILDEVTSDLDPAGKTRLLKVIGDLYAGLETIVATTHAYEEAQRGDAILILDEGRSVAHGTPAEIICRAHLMKEHGIRPRDINLLAEKEKLPPVPPRTDPAALLDELKSRFNPRKYESVRDRERKRAERCGQPIIEVSGLSRRAEDGRSILSDVHLTVREREMLAIVGRNGAGKTTLVKHFNGLLRPCSGEVKVKGASTRQRSLFELCQTVGFVFQNPDHQIFSETVRKELSFGPRNFGVGEKEIETRVSEAITAVRLHGLEDEDPLLLSKGGRQKIAVASILAMRPQILVLDEPTTGLDYEETRALMELVRTLNTSGHTVIMVTHTMWVVGEYADRVIVMDAGKIIADTTPRELFANASLLETAGLMAPEIAQMSHRFLGETILSHAEMQECLDPI